MIGYLNLGSLILGLIALILPISNLLQYSKEDKPKNWYMLSMISISSCAISLGFQIFSTNNRVKDEDWSALMDTMGTVAFASAVLLSLTIILNVLTFIIYREKNIYNIRGLR